MEHRCEEDNYFQGSKFHQEEHYCFLDFSFEYLLEDALFFSTQHRYASTATQSISLQDELDALFEGDILAHLKKRCRELGIPRWLHRKVKSLQTLIKIFQELGRDTREEGGRTKIVVEMLQQTKKLIEERPGEFVLDQETIVLRQVCFKEQFKRRRLMVSDG